MAGSAGVTVEGAEEIKALLKEVGLGIKDLRGAMKDVGDHAIKIFSGQVFASQGGFINEPWQRLNDTYAKRKAKKYSGRPPLVRTGKMQRSFVKSVSPMEVTIGNKAAYFKYHQSSETRYVLPRRAMLGIYNGMQQDVTDTIAAALTRRIKARAS